jgi:tRNA pseudouridine55 synthase
MTAMTDGLVVVDKPAGWTSHDVVARCRKIFGQRRIGHSGTLDPDATGLLLVGLGRVTRLLRFLTDLPKTYEANVVLGTTTTTLDAGGAVVDRFDMRDVTLADARAAAATLTGAIEQVPPMVSAVKVQGQRLHELARRGEEVERDARPVTVYRFDVTDTTEAGVFHVLVECSSGTYVRVLAADLGERLGGGAHLRNLRRTAIGSFTLADAKPLAAVAKSDVIPPADALRDYPSATVSADEAAAVTYGREITAHHPGPWRVLSASGDLLAIYEDAQPAVVLSPAN